MVGTQGGPEAFEVGGVKHEGIGRSIEMCGVGLRNTLEAFKGVGGGGVIPEDV
jgi:hypothetical protein